MNDEQKETSGFRWGERQAETDSIEGPEEIDAKVAGSVSARQMGKERRQETRQKGERRERRTRELRDRRIKMVVETETKRIARKEMKTREKERERVCGEIDV